mmetsp:Transcript_56255/g.131784  ORF Transcript_56255/g.131784 Transcript_56255/m.131784 type:complete len:488 (+) Transcript_56255:80-1543(+)
MTVIWSPAAQGQLQGLNANDPPPTAVARDPPLSARQRKQVYMSSNLFDEGAPPPHSKYVATRQAEIYDKIRTLKRVEPKVMDYSKPLPAEMRLTANSGQAAAASIQKVPSRTDGGYGTRVQFGDHAEPFNVVGLSKPSEHLPKEMWGTNTKLGWSDMRSEILRPQGAEMKAWNNADARSRKRQDLSSEVIASGRQVHPSTQRPGQEIRSAPMKNIHCTDTSLDPQARSKRSSSLAPRDRFVSNLACSEDCQFNDQETRDTSAPPPLRWRSGGGADSKRDSSESRRRTERNFSDLTGTARGCATRTGLSSGNHVHHSAGNNFLNPNNETESRKGPRQFVSPRCTQEMNRSAVLGDYDPGQLDVVLQSARAPGEQQVLNTERAAFDTRSVMELESEITRRQRERGITPRPRSASQRRRDFFAGGDGRVGTGATPRPSTWDQEQPKSAQPTDRRQILRSASTSPASARRYGFPPDSARARKMAAMQSSIL